MYVRKVVEYIFWRMRVVSCRSQAEIMEREDFTHRRVVMCVCVSVGKHNIIGSRVLLR